MANLTPTASWDDVFQLETTTPVLGGPGGPSNLQAQALLNRTEVLKNEDTAVNARARAGFTYGGKWSAGMTTTAGYLYTGLDGLDYVAQSTGVVSTTEPAANKSQFQLLIVERIVATSADINALIASASPGQKLIAKSISSGAIVGEKVQVPVGIDLTLTGKFTVSTPVGFERVTTSDALSPIKLQDAHIVCSTAGAKCFNLNLKWQDVSGSIVVDDASTFDLSNGSVGIALGRCFFPQINGTFTMDSTSSAILLDASEIVGAWAYPSCPMNLTIGATFIGGRVFSQLLVAAGSPWHSVEGLVMTAKSRVYSSIVEVVDGNGVFICSAVLESAKTLLDSVFNSRFSPAYADRNTDGQQLLTVKTTKRSTQGLVIDPAIMQAQGKYGDMILFTDAGSASGAEITNVSFGAKYLCGNGKNATTPVSAVVFDHALMRNFISDGAQNFQAMNSPYEWKKPVTRSTIARFEARDVNYYAKGISSVFTESWGSYFNNFDSLYNVISVYLMVPTYVSSGVTEDVMITSVSFPPMQRAPVATVASTPVLGGFLITAPITYSSSIEAHLVKPSSAPGGTRGAATASITLDATTWIAPR